LRSRAADHARRFLLVKARAPYGPAVNDLTIRACRLHSGFNRRLTMFVNTCRTQAALVGIFVGRPRDATICRGSAKKLFLAAATSGKSAVAGAGAEGADPQADE